MDEFTQEKIPVIRIKKAAKEKLLEKYGIALGSFLLMIGIAIVVFIIMALAFSGTVLRPLMLKFMEVAGATDEAGLLKIENEFIDMMNTPKYLMISELISAFIGALFATLSTGYIRICLKISRMEQPSIKDLFYAYKNNPDRVILIYFITFFIQFLIGLPTDILARKVQADMNNTQLYLIYMVTLILVTVITVLFAFLVFPTFYIYVDNPDMPVVDIFKESFKMMKGNKGRLFALIMSFMGWIVLSLFTLGTLLIWVAPYLQMALTEYYRNINGEKLWISKSNYQGNLESDTIR